MVITVISREGFLVRALMLAEWKRHVRTEVSYIHCVQKKLLHVLYDDEAEKFQDNWKYRFVKTSLKIVPIRFHAGRRTRRRNPALASDVYFVLQYLFGLLANLCFCCVRFCFISTKLSDWLGRTSLRNDLFFCVKWDVTRTHQEMR